MGRTIIKKHTKNHSMFGAVGGKRHWCFDCQKEVPNTDWKEEKEMMDKIEEKSQLSQQKEKK